MKGPTQKNRSVEFICQLGPDKLLLRSASIREELGRSYEIQVDLVSAENEVPFDKIVGTKACVRLETNDPKNPRFFHGIVSQFSQSAASGKSGDYRATLVPWLWLLTRTSDCRIFQNKSIPDIIKQVFRDKGFTDFEDKLSGTYQPWEYCVQYRETHFNFVCRLMEHEGIYFFFKHEKDKHTLVLCDSNSAHEAYEGYETIKFYEETEGSHEADTINHWNLLQQVQPDTYALTDFNFEKPKTSLLGKSQIPRSHEQSAAEIFDYPGEYEQTQEGLDYSKIRIEELNSQFEVERGQANARGLAAGHTFTLEEHQRDDQNRKYLVTSTAIQLTGDSFEASGGAGGGDLFSVNFTTLDAEQTFRPARVTPKPLIQGPQTAIVTGPKGDEIHTDKYGRIKVHFHWDRHGKFDENSSCWIRLSQAGWAGKKWGAMHIPRIGQEVIVEHLEGDPDLPIITGRVYNADSMPPYDLPAEKTKTTLKSNSSVGGEGFNEFRFEDKKGEEQVFLHGEKNLDIRIKHDRFETILHDRHLQVENEKFETVKVSRHEEINKSHFEKIGEDRNVDVGGKEAIHVGKSQSVGVDGDVIYEIGGNLSEKVSGKIYFSATGDLVLESVSNITLKVGGSYVAISPAGVGISGPLIKIN